MFNALNAPARLLSIPFGNAYGPERFHCGTVLSPKPEKNAYCSAFNALNIAMGGR